MSVAEESGIDAGPGGALLDEIAETITTGLVAFLDVKEFRTRLLTNVANFVLPLLRPDLNAYVSRLLHNATQEAQRKNAGDGSAQEPRPDLKDIDPDVIHKKVGIVAGVAVGVMIVYVGLLHCLERSCCPGGRRRAAVASGSRGGGGGSEALTSPLMMEAEAARDGRGGSGGAPTEEELGHACDDAGDAGGLGYHDGGSSDNAEMLVSLASIYAGTWKRLGVPVLHILCAAVGAWSLSVPVCDVRVRVTGGLLDAGKVVLDDSLLVYTFPQMVSDFWKSGSWMIAVLLVAGTAVLPQVKGVLSIVVWAVPMRHRHRGHALTSLDVVGRFVLVCQVFIMLVVATLRARISFPGLVSDVVAEPIHSIAGATTGLLGMMLVSQFTVYLHDVGPSVVSRRKKTKMGRQVSSSNSGGGSGGGGGSKFAHDLRRIPTSMVVVLLLVAAVSTVLSVTMEILEFQIEGIAGDAEATAASETPSVKRISLAGLPSVVYADTDQKGVAVFASVALVMFTIASPLVCIVGWTLQWWWVLRHHRHPVHDKGAPAWIRAVAYMNTYVYSWCALDVVWFAVGSSALEMNLVTQWIVQKQPGIGEACRTLEQWTDGQTECVKVVGRLTEGSWFLLAAAVSTAAVFGLTCKVFGVRYTVRV